MKTNVQNVNKGRTGGRLLSAVLMLLAAAAASLLAQQRIPRPECCGLIYSTGRWLGWAAALLEYTREREAPVPEDQIIYQCLTEAGRGAEAAYRACGLEVAAWPDWQQCQSWMAGHIVELQKTGPEKTHRDRRKLVASAISTTYELWASELSLQKLGEDYLRNTTCATLYFKLGFDLAFATQCYRQAQESYNNYLAVPTGSLERSRFMQAVIAQLNRTRFGLHRSLAVLQAYGALPRQGATSQGCAFINADALEAQLREIANRAPSIGRMGAEFQTVSELSDRTGRLLEANCITGRRQTTARPPEQLQPQPPDAVPSGQRIFVGTQIKVSPYRRSLGHQENIPVVVLEQTGPRTFRLLRQNWLGFDTNAYKWAEDNKDTTARVFGDWLEWSYIQDQRNQRRNTIWMVRVPAQAMSQLQVVQRPGYNALVPPNVPHNYIFNSWEVPPHCSDGDPNCSGDITGIWCWGGDFYWKIALEQRQR